MTLDTHPYDDGFEMASAQPGDETLRAQVEEALQYEYLNDVQI